MTRLPSKRRFAAGLALLALSGGVAWFIISGRITPGSPKSERIPGAPNVVEIRGPTGRRSPRASGERGVYPFNRVVVVAVGINRYESLTGTADLRFAEADARAFADLTRDAYGYESETILGSEATKVGIERTLERYGQELGDQDALIVFFAGHGQVIELPESGEAGYLIPADAQLDINDRTDTDRWATEALDMQYLTELIEGMGARHVLFIADACASGFMTKRGSLERWDLKTFLFDRSRTILTATTRRQSAREDSRARHGYFTEALLKELKKGDAASVLDLYLPVLRAVAEGTNGNMTPQLAHVGDGDGMFVFIPQSLSKEEIEGDLRGVAPDVAVRGRGLAGVANRARLLARQATTFEDVVRAHEAQDYRFASDAEDRKRVWEERSQRFKRNALMGDVWAMAALHLCYHKGLGTEKDPRQAYHWARQADRAEQPAGLGRYLLGRCYQYGLGVPVTGPAAEEVWRRMYRESADRGSPLGRYALARGILRSESLSKDDAIRGKELLEQAVGAGVLAAEVDLALELNRQRPDLPRDEKRAVSLLEHAAGRENPVAHYELYKVLVEGVGELPREGAEKAASHLRRASELGWPDALVELGLVYRDGPGGRLGLAKDEQKAFALLDRAAQSGHLRALGLTAAMLARGQGAEKDFMLARTRLEAAVRGGSRVAEREQGFWYLDGTVYRQSDEEALACFRRAADKGDAIASYNAGVMYCVGRGFPVRPRWEDEVPFHRDWHLGLHYLVRARELGLDEEKPNNFVRDVVGDYRNALLERGYDWPTGGHNIPLAFYYLTAPDIADDWKATHPDSFAYFCEKADIDPETFKETR